VGAVWGGDRPAGRRAKAPLPAVHGPLLSPLSSFTALPATINHGYGRLSCRFGALSTRRGASSSQARCGAAAAGRAVLGAAATPTSYRLHAACLRSDRLASFLTGKRSPLTSAPVLTEPPDIPTGRCQSVACRGRSCTR
jgi:hypothetical protein